MSLTGPRPNNEDSYLLRNGGGGSSVRAVLAVADGMGGYADGEVASRLAVDTVAKALESAKAGTEAVRQAFDLADSEIRKYSLTSPAARVVGTTLTVAVVGASEAVVGHVGDSRAYLFHEGALQQVTVDHSKVGRLVRSGVISEEEALGHPEANVLEQALGAGGDISVDVYRVGIGPGDILLLSTDGLHGAVPRHQIERVLREQATMQLACERLAALAEQMGSDDNVTVLAWEYPKRSLRTPTNPGTRVRPSPESPARATAPPSPSEAPAVASRPAKMLTNERNIRIALLVGALLLGVVFGILLRVASRW